MKCAIYLHPSNRNSNKLHAQLEKINLYLNTQHWESNYFYMDTAPKMYDQLKMMIEQARLEKFNIIIAPQASQLLKNLKLAEKLEQLVIMKKIQLLHWIISLILLNMVMRISDC